MVPSNSQNMALLQAAISPNPNSSSTDEDITIVDGTSLLPDIQKPTDVKTANEDQISLYVVRKGDTLPAIASMFGVSANTIRWANNISGSTISVGQTLVILPITGIQHTVKSGDTLVSIAKLYKGDLNEILQYNDLSKNSKLAVGDTIFIPDGDITSTSISSGSSSSSSSGSTGTKAPSYPSYSGYYMRPIIGGIRTQGIHGHNGVDLASSYGASILASADGDVIISRDSGWNGGYGDYIVLKHANGTQTLYGHLSATLVNVGDHVTQGQVIGKEGNTGNVSGPTGIHLHFEIRGAKNPF
jgi:murein DD-endopeptidase MepM/ murein hydrolase activator NlpD